MKKLISALLVLNIITIFLIPPGLAEFNDVSDSEAVDVVTGLKLMEGYADGTFLPENNLTRAEFAQIISDIYTYGTEDNAVSEWKMNFFNGVVEDETALIPPEVMNQSETAIYSDVMEDSENYDAIKLVTQYNLMAGVGNGEFDPDGNVTNEQALKVILTLMGYGYQAQMLGGYPSGYIAAASQTGLNKGIGQISDYATRLDIAQILYNALEIPLMQYGINSDGSVYYSSFEDDTFLTKILNLAYERGRMTGNGYTNLSGESKYGTEWIVINGKSFKVNDETEYVRDFLGRDVEIYYSLDDEIDEFVYARLSGRDTTVEIDISEFIEYSSNTLVYSPKDSTKNKTVKIIDAPYILKNGSVLDGFDDTAFDFNYGTITVITPAKDSKADLIMIKSYQNFNINLADKTNNYIYSQASPIGNLINLGDDEKYIRIYDSQGDVTTKDALVNGVVTTVCYGDKIIEIYISDKLESKFYIKSVNANDDNEYQISDGTTTYSISKDFSQMNPEFMPNVGKNYDLKIDILGKVVSIKESAGEEIVAFMNNVKKIDDDEDYIEKISIKYFDLTSRTLNSAYVASKVKIILSDGTSKNYSLDKSINIVTEILYESICENIENVMTRTGGMFRYKMNENGEFNYIEIPGIQENSLDDSSRLVEIKTNNALANSNMFSGSAIFGGNIIFTNNTKILQCNYTSDKFDEDSGYNIITKNDLKEGEKYDIKAYSTVKNSPIAEYVIYTNDPSKSISTEPPQTCGIVLDFYSALDSDDEARDYIVMNTGEFMVESGVLDKGNVQNMQGAVSYKDASGRDHEFIVEKGDIIRYGLSVDGRINQIQLVYDENADYSDGVTIGGKLYDGWSERGNLAGCIAGFDSGIYQYSNPFSASSTSSGNTFATDPYAWSYYNGNMRVMVGTVVRTGSDYVVTTTRNLQENPGDVNIDGDGVYATNLWNVSSFKLVTVSKKQITVTEEPISQLKSYAAVGSSCDRVFITSRLGAVFNFMVYRYD